MTRYGLEVCAATLASVEAARQGGATRIELCSALSADGITPTRGMIKRACEICGDKVDVHVLFRPREGNFVYSQQEIDQLCEDIADFASYAPERAGIVIGALTAEGEIDVPACKKMIAAAGKIKNVTFHRAIDVCSDPLKALEQIIDLGCNRVLTSGHEKTALEGVETLKQMVKIADNRISIMAGSGVNVTNAETILKATGVKELHGSCRSKGLDSDPEQIRIIAHLLK